MIESYPPSLPRDNLCPPSDLLEKLNQSITPLLGYTDRDPFCETAMREISSRASHELAALPLEPEKFQKLQTLIHLLSLYADQDYRKCKETAEKEVPQFPIWTQNTGTKEAWERGWEILKKCSQLSRDSSEYYNQANFAWFAFKAALHKLELQPDGQRAKLQKSVIYRSLGSTNKVIASYQPPTQINGTINTCLRVKRLAIQVTNKKDFYNETYVSFLSSIENYRKSIESVLLSELKEFSEFYQASVLKFIPMCAIHLTLEPTSISDYPDTPERSPRLKETFNSTKIPDSNDSELLDEPNSPLIT